MPDELTGAVEGAGGLRLFYRGRVAGVSRGRLLAVHGLGDHSGRFGRLAEAVHRSGLDFYALDLRGHGRSQGRRGHAMSFDRLLQDVERFRRRARADGAVGPTFLLGHSLGGLVVGRYVQEFGFPDLAGAVLAAPFLELQLEPPPWKLRLGDLTDRIVPVLTLGNGIRLEDRFRGPEECELWENDPLVHDRISTRLWGEMRRNSDLFRARAGQMQTPFLVLVPGDDRIVRAATTRDSAAGFGGPTQVHEYADACHSLFQDPSTDAVLRDTMTWLESRMADEAGAAGTGLV